jgi:hypothetical protein
MLEYIGVTNKNEKVYSLSKEFGVDESGMIIKIDNDKDSFIFTKYYIDMEIKKDSSIEEMRSKVLDLRKVSIDGYVLNLFEFELDGVPYIQVIKGSPEEDELIDRVKELPLKNQFFAKNQEAIVFIHIGNSSAIIKKDLRPKFHQDNEEEENKKLIAILKSISCQFGDKYENFEELKSRGQLDF